MGLFEDVVINARSAASVVGEKAGRLVDISKLRIDAADLNAELNKRFEAMGRVVYDAKKTGTSPEELVEESVRAIDEIYEQLDAVNEQLAAMRNSVTCSKCGQDNPVAAHYCSKCGSPLEPNETANPQADTCTNDSTETESESQEPKE